MYITATAYITTTNACRCSKQCNTCNTDKPFMQTMVVHDGAMPGDITYMGKYGQAIYGKYCMTSHISTPHGHVSAEYAAYACADNACCEACGAV